MNLPKTQAESKYSIWFRPVPAFTWRIAFDLFWGIIAPLLCLAFDPIVFIADGMGWRGAYLSVIRLFGYPEIALSILALGWYLATRRASPLLAGALAAGSLFAFLLGIVMLPLSLLGLQFLIGLAGFTPFFTGWVFLRNARHCWHEVPRPARLLSAQLGVVLILGIPATFQGGVFYAFQHALQTVQTGEDADFPRAVQTLRHTKLFLSPDRIIFAYQQTIPQSQRDRLARAYRAVTGRDIQKRIEEMSDD